MRVYIGPDVHDATGRRRMAVTYIHTCYRILEPEKSKDFYVNKLGMKKLGEMDLGSATNHFFAMEEDASSPMLELTHNHDRPSPTTRATATPTSHSRWTI
jgi:catechol 2,3-dioxygenase-like lactoylglutathione lyase family enzyme